MNKPSIWITSIFLGATLITSAGVPPRQEKYPAPRVQGAAQTPFRLTGPDLGVMLKDLKYETATTAQGQFQISVKQGTYTFHPFVAVSSSGNKIWITWSIRPLSAIDLTNADLLSKLLLANTAVGPAQFYIENLAADKQPADFHLGFGYPLDNRGVTEEILKEALDSFATDLVDQASIWDAGKK